jgi:hypothetical protein
MDLQTATSSSGRLWQLARLGALMFLVLSCGLLVSSLLNPGRVGLDKDAAGWRQLR